MAERPGFDISGFLEALVTKGRRAYGNDLTRRQDAFDQRERQDDVAGSIYAPVEEAGFEDPGAAGGQGMSMAATERAPELADREQRLIEGLIRLGSLDQARALQTGISGDAAAGERQDTVNLAAGERNTATNLAAGERNTATNLAAGERNTATIAGQAAGRMFGAGMSRPSHGDTVSPAFIADRDRAAAQGRASDAAAGASGAQQAGSEFELTEAEAESRRAEAGRQAIRDSAAPQLAAERAKVIGDASQGMSPYSEGPDDSQTAGQLNEQSQLRLKALESAPGGLGGDPMQAPEILESLMDPEGYRGQQTEVQHIINQKRQASIERTQVLSKIDLAKLDPELAKLVQEALLTGEQVLTERLMRDPTIQALIAETLNVEQDTRGAAARLQPEIENIEADTAQTIEETTDTRETRPYRQQVMEAKARELGVKADRGIAMLPHEIASMEANAFKARANGDESREKAEDLRRTRDSRNSERMASTGLLKKRGELYDNQAKLGKLELMREEEVFLDRIEQVRWGTFEAGARTRKILVDMKIAEKDGAIRGESADLLRQQIYLNNASVKEKTRGDKINNDLNELAADTNIAGLRQGVYRIAKQNKLLDQSLALGAIKSNAAERWIDAKVANIEVKTEREVALVQIAQVGANRAMRGADQAANQIGPMLKQLFMAMEAGDDERADLAGQMLNSFLQTDSKGATGFGPTGRKTGGFAGFGERDEMGITQGRPTGGAAVTGPDDMGSILFDGGA